MNRRQLFTAVFTVLSVVVLGIGGFAQGKGHGGGGNPHGGGGNPHAGGPPQGGGGNPHGGGNGGGNGRGQEVRQQGGGGNPHGRGGDDAMRQQRAIQQQQMQQQRAAQQQQWQQQVQQQRAAQQQQRAAQQQQWQQQRQADMNARIQQRANEDNSRRQQQANQQAWRQQQEAMRQQSRQQYIPQPQMQPQWNGRHDNGKHNGWTADGPRGNAYGLRGIWPGEFRGVRDPDKQARRYDRENERDWRRNNNAATYYNYDPIQTWAPQVYQSYAYPTSRYNNSGYPAYNNYGYQPDYYQGYAEPRRESIVRSLISSFFAPDSGYGYGNYGYAVPQYYGYNTPQYYGYQQPAYYGYQTPNYYYSNAGYAPQYYGAGYDPYGYGYGGAPMFGGQLFGGTGVKSAILNVGLQLLQGFLGQGYQQGINDGQYVRENYGNDVYYDPYYTSEPAYYSPYASSFADQRQTFEEGYRLGYEDAMRNQDPYGNMYGNNANVNLVTQFLANSLLGS